MIPLEMNLFEDLFDTMTVFELIKKINLKKEINKRFSEMLSEDLLKNRLLSKVESVSRDLAETLIYNACKQTQILDFKLLTPKSLEKLLSYILSKCSLQSDIKNQLIISIETYFEKL